MLCCQSRRFEILLDAVGAAIQLTPSSRSVEAPSSSFAGRPALTTSQPAPVTDGPRFHSLSEPSPTDHHMVFPGTLSDQRTGGRTFTPMPEVRFGPSPSLANPRLLYAPQQIQINGLEPLLKPVGAISRPRWIGSGEASYRFGIGADQMT
jgi:hypothetical protein